MISSLDYIRTSRAILGTDQKVYFYKQIYSSMQRLSKTH